MVTDKQQMAICGIWDVGICTCVVARLYNNDEILRIIEEKNVKYDYKWKNKLYRPLYCIRRCLLANALEDWWIERYEEKGKGIKWEMQNITGQYGGKSNYEE